MPAYLLSGLVVLTDAVTPGAPIAPAGREPDLRVTRQGERTVPGTIEAGPVLQAATWGDRLQYCTVRRPDGSVVLRLPGLVEFVVDPDLRTVRSWLDPRCDLELYALLVGGNLLATVLLLRGETALHASAVERDGLAVAFVAHSGMGKSTLAALACARGARFVTDDLLRVDHRGPGDVRCLPGGTENRLRRPLAEIVGSDPGTTTRRSVDGRQVWRPPGTGPEVPRLVAVVLPELVRGAADTRVRRLRPGVALLELARRPRLLGWTDPAGSAQVFADLSALVREVPVFAARLPWGLPPDPAMIDELLDAVGLPITTRCGIPTPAR